MAEGLMSDYAEMGKRLSHLAESCTEVKILTMRGQLASVPHGLQMGTSIWGYIAVGIAAGLSSGLLDALVMLGR